MSTDQPEPKGERSRKASQKAAAHTVAEWVSLVISALLILGIAGYLLYEASKPNGPFIPVEIQAHLEEVRQVDGRFILPVRILNRGGQTLRDLKIELRSSPSAGSAPEPSDVVIDYLGKGSEQTAFFFFDQHPRELKLEPRAISYRVE